MSRKFNISYLEAEYDDYLNEEASETEKIKAFNQRAIVDRDSVILTISNIEDYLAKYSKDDIFRSPAYYQRMMEMLTSFRERVSYLKLFDNLEPWWGYGININEYRIELLLHHFRRVSFNTKIGFHNIDVDETYTLLEVNSKLLTIEEYSNQYDVGAGTVRQWIRRGKIRSAVKYGNEWRIPEIAFVNPRGYKLGRYKVTQKLQDFPEEYPLLEHAYNIEIKQDKDDRTLYLVKFACGQYGGVQVVGMNKLEKEKFELFLISHPLIEFESFGEHIMSRDLGGELE